MQKKAYLNSVPNYVGPNHDSDSIFKRNNTMIANAVQQQMFGERWDENGYKNDLYHKKYGK